MNNDQHIYHVPWRLVPNHIRGEGGREIDLFRGLSPEQAVDTDHGSEAWIGSVTRVVNPPVGAPDYGISEVILPDGRRMHLHEAIALNPQAILGGTHCTLHGEGLGVLVKHLDAQRQYGLQCHPTRPWAKQMWDSDYGKEESWYVLGTRSDTEEPAWILLGFKENVTRAEFERHYRAKDIRALENLCHKIVVQPGDAFFVGGGCPHALGEGCFVIEVQEPSDITLGALPLSCHKPDATAEEAALYDERLLGAYAYDGCSYDENLRRWQAPKKHMRHGDWGEENFIIGPDQTNYFSLTELMVRGTAPIPPTGHPRIAIVTEGSGKLIYDDDEIDVKRGDEIFLPFDVKALRASGDLHICLCHPEGAYATDA